MAKLAEERKQAKENVIAVNKTKQEIMAFLAQTGQEVDLNQVAKIMAV